MARQSKLNSQLTGKQILDCCQLEKSSLEFLAKITDHMGISARGMHRVLKVARTIADLNSQEKVSNKNLAEAVQYRRLETLMKPKV